ncbi:hypothetical protein [Pararhizobium arenae]|nr:hypothetical protein [Pararhizobium arenae]
MEACDLLEEHFRGDGDNLRDLWISGWNMPPVAVSN